MPKLVVLIVILSLLAGLLGACNLPASLTITPSSAPPARIAANTAPPPTARPTPIPTPAPAIHLDQIHMLTASAGWGWAPTATNTRQLLRTSDGGQSWKDVSPPGNYDYYGSFFLNPQTAWLSFYNTNTSTGGLLRTSDGGQNWQTLPSTEIPQNTWFEFSSPNLGVAETASMGAGNAYINYYQTSDGGATWQPIIITPPTPQPDLPAGTLHLCNICADNLYYHPDRTIITYGDMASDPTGLLRISISTDLGQHWKDLQMPLPDKYAAGSVMPLTPSFFGLSGLLPVNLIKYNPDGSLAFSVLLLYTTQDGGLNWQAAPAGLESQQPQTNTIQILSMQDVFVRCGQNLCATHDGAQTWHELPSSLNFDQSAPAIDYVSQTSFIDASTGWAITGETGSTTLWHTTNGAQTWQKLLAVGS